MVQDAVDAITDATQGERLGISAMTAWELGVLVSKNRLMSSRPPLRWFEEFAAITEAEVQGVTPAILVASSFLPGSVHNDPMDRILIATARENDMTIVTRDRAILAYGAAGHVRTMAC